MYHKKEPCVRFTLTGVYCQFHLASNLKVKKSKKKTNRETQVMEDLKQFQDWVKGK